MVVIDGLVTNVELKQKEGDDFCDKGKERQVK
jgi:hypothetical protein